MAEQTRKFGARIAELRDEKNWKQRDLVAKMAELGDQALNTNQLSRYENGGAFPGEQRRAWFAEALGTTEADLYLGPMDERKPPKEGDLDNLSGERGESDPDRQIEELQSEVAELRSDLSEVRSDLRLVLSLLQRGERGQGDAGS